MKRARVEIVENAEAPKEGLLEKNLGKDLGAASCNY